MKYKHPGHVLLKDFLQPLGISQYRLSKDIGVTPMRISEIVRGKRAITPETALRLSRYFKVSPHYWMELQVNYDLATLEAKIGKQLEKEITSPDELNL